MLPIEYNTNNCLKVQTLPLNNVKPNKKKFKKINSCTVFLLVQGYPQRTRPQQQPKHPKINMFLCLHYVLRSMVINIANRN